MFAGDVPRQISVHSTASASDRGCVLRPDGNDLCSVPRHLDDECPYEHDWSATGLGKPESWPEALKAPLRLMLMSRFEMWLGWGRDLNFFYNDAYIPTLGLKHPDALGPPMADVWKEVFDAVKDRIEFMRRAWQPGTRGSCSCSSATATPKRPTTPSPTARSFGDDRTVLGLMCVVTEETERVISERRLNLLNHLSSALLDAKTRSDVAAAIERQTMPTHATFRSALSALFDDAQRPDAIGRSHVGPPWRAQPGRAA